MKKYLLILTLFFTVIVFSFTSNNKTTITLKKGYDYALYFYTKDISLNISNIRNLKLVKSDDDEISHYFIISKETQEFQIYVKPYNQVVEIRFHNSGSTSFISDLFIAYRYQSPDNSMSKTLNQSLLSGYNNYLRDQYFLAMSDFARCKYFNFDPFVNYYFINKISLKVDLISNSLLNYHSLKSINSAYSKFLAVDILYYFYTNDNLEDGYDFVTSEGFINDKSVYLSFYAIYFIYNSTIKTKNFELLEKKLKELNGIDFLYKEEVNSMLNTIKKNNLEQI